MSESLSEQAEAAGVSVRWRDVHGEYHDVAPATLHAVLDALGPQTDEPGPLITADVGSTFNTTGLPGPFRITLEDGTVREGHAEDAGNGHIRLPPIDRDGYHWLDVAGRDRTMLAVAPARCWTIAEATGGRKVWGLAVQLYGLRRAGDGGLGDLASLRDLAREAGSQGAAAIAISPIHALFTATPGHFSPYAPSSRIRLNVLHAEPPHLDIPDSDNALVDWTAAAPARIAAWRRSFDPNDPGLAEYRRTQGIPLERHARFELLHGLHASHDWRTWPEALRSPDSPEVARIAADHADEVAFHAFLQWRTELSLGAAQAEAHAAGMPIGLIADIAVGTDSSGSDAWCRPDEMLRGLTIGAPPDLINTSGQDWGVTTFSPSGLIRQGFSGFIELLRSSMRHAGGVRIDHVMGLARLWVVPRGMSAAQGAYLRFPLDDLLRLVKIESRRHRAIVLGEDLGTLPDGFRERLQDAGLAGLRVLWFERDNMRFLPPQQWSGDAVAMTSTHDLSTVAGWWQGRDLEWRAKLTTTIIEDEDTIRNHDRAALWDAFRASGSAHGEMPASQDSGPVADAAAAHIGHAACPLAILPIEDALALPEQPNLPGTIDEHPNWRRRLAAPADALLRRPDVASRLAALHQARLA
jgi:4-alpha-glucanotransferase